jgi:hypothetical protein
MEERIDKELREGEGNEKKCGKVEDTRSRKNGSRE